MAKNEDQNRNSTNSRPVSLYPLSPDEALGAALQVKKAEVKALEKHRPRGGPKHGDKGRKEARDD